MTHRQRLSRGARGGNVAMSDSIGGGRMSRRDFLRQATVVTAAASLSTGLPGRAFAQPASVPSDARVAIIGAGLAGLTAAYRLRQNGINATVYEARNRVGGRTHSIRTSSGLVYDLGGSFINTDHSDMLTLAKDLGLALFDRNMDAARTRLPLIAYYMGGRDIDEATVAADFRPLETQITEDARRVFNLWDTYAPQFDQISVAQYLDRHRDKITAPYIRELLMNSIRTEYGVEAADSSALQLLFLTPSVTGRSVDILSYSDEQYTVVGGSQRIADELTKRLPGQVVLNRALTQVRRTGDVYTIDFAGRSGSVEADWVIVTVPASLLRTITFPSTLPAGFRDYLANVNLGRNEKVIAGVGERAWRTGGEFALGAWTDLGYSSVWDATQRQIDRRDAALTLYYGGAEVAGIPSNNKLASHLQRLYPYVPGLQQATSGSFQRTNWTNDPWSKGAYVNFRPGELMKWADYFWIETGGANATQEVVFDGLVFAGEHTSDQWYGFMNGAAQTGRLAANAVLARVASAPGRR